MAALATLTTRGRAVNVGEAGVAKVGQSLQRVCGEVDEESGRRRGRLAMVKGKTEGSEATVAIPESLITVLRMHRRDHAGRGSPGRTAGGCGFMTCGTLS